MSPESYNPKNLLDEPEIQQILEKYGDQPIVYKAESGEETGTVREALEDSRCPLKDMLIAMPFEAQEMMIKQFISSES